MQTMPRKRGLSVEISVAIKFKEGNFRAGNKR